VSQIFNKSSHPVAVKRIPVRIWALRDEIEAAIDRRIKECDAAGTPLYLDDIKEYYGMRTDKPLAGQPQLQLVPEPTEGAPKDSVDAMMEALAATPPEATPEPTPPAASETTAPPVEAVVEKADEMVAAQTPAQKAEAPAAPHVQRPYTRLAPDSAKVSYGFALLADVNMDWILTFSKEKFIQGQSVVVEFLIPHPFMMSAEIIMCHNYAMRSRIISESKPDFRLQCRFTYPFPGERTRLREFLTSVEPVIPKKGGAPKASANDTGPEV
jgi:hypothetical protein